jgi:surface carbohydrate biosynthesis protein
VQHHKILNTTLLFGLKFHVVLKPSKIIYFPMEIAARELDSRLLMAVIAVARGFEVMLGQKWLIERNIERMTPGIYFSKTLTIRDAKMLKRAKAAGYITAAIDEESPGLAVEHDTFWWVASEAVAATDMIFMPGTRNIRHFATCHDVPENHVRAAANPRWDLLRSELRPVLEPEAAELRRRHGDFILVNSNLGLSNSKKGSAAEMIQGLIDQGKVHPSDKRLLRLLDDIVKMEAGNKAALLHLLPRLAERFPSLKIVLRPHPSEDMEAWSNWVPSIPNLTVIREGSAIPWIMAARLLVHTNCTTGVEAVALDRSAICLVPEDNPANARYLANQVNPVVSNLEETLDMVERILLYPQSCYTPAMLETFRDRMSHEHERLGTEAVIDTIIGLGDEQFASRSAAKNVSAWRPSNGYRWRIKDKNVRGALFPDIEMADVHERIQRFQTLLRLDSRIRIEACGNKVLLLSPWPLSFATRLRRIVGQRW